MRNGFLATLVVVLSAWRVGAEDLPGKKEAQVLPKQTPVAAGLTPVANSVSKDIEPGTARDIGNCDLACHAPTDFCCENPECRKGRFWVSADYLVWWIKSGPVNTPLMASGDPGDRVPGALDQPGTTVTFGNAPLNYGTFSGLRLGAGFELCSGLSIEGNYFVLERRTVSFNQASDANGNPMFGRPYFDTFNNLENNLNTAFPDPNAGGFAGASSITAGTRLQGYEINLAAELGCDDNCNRRVSVLAGFRALDLTEYLLFQDTLFPPGTGNINFGTNPVDPTSTVTDFDKFHTSNHFYGGQIGARVDWCSDRFTVRAAAKVAFGSTQELVRIDGASTLNTPGQAPVTMQGGLLAQSSNIGRYYRSEFGIVPEAQINLGWKITPCLTATFGYTFIYWNAVARPGNQIDRNINSSLIPTHQSFGQGNNQGPPFFNFHASDFWAQGINLGLELRF